MPLSETLLPEWEHEMANTRTTLERVPEGKLGWKPHEKSGTMGWLAGHLANIPSWATFMLAEESLDLAPQGVCLPPPLAPNSRRELLETFDKNVASGRAAIAGASDAQLLKPWTLLSSGNPIFTLPRIAALRSFVMNHTIHHRAQLGVYLRLNNIPVPALYGPSADEGSM